MTANNPVPPLPVAQPIGQPMVQQPVVPPVAQQVVQPVAQAVVPIGQQPVVQPVATPPVAVPPPARVATPEETKSEILKVETNTLEALSIDGVANELVVEFWRLIRQIKELVYASDYGAKKGRGGSELKDSHQLHHDIRTWMLERDMDFDIIPENVTITPIIIGSNITYLVQGVYFVKWTINGTLVYKTRSFGSFDQANSSQATHGSYTAARTSLMFNIFQASVKSEQSMDANRQNDMNRQSPRPVAQPSGGGY